MVRTWEIESAEKTVAICLDALKKGKGWNLKLDSVRVEPQDGMMVLLYYTQNSNTKPTLLMAWIDFIYLVGQVHKTRYSDVEFSDYENTKYYSGLCKKIILDIHRQIKQYIKEHPSNGNI